MECFTWNIAGDRSVDKCSTWNIACVTTYRDNLCLRQSCLSQPRMMAVIVELVCVREATGASLRSCVCAAGPEPRPGLADS